MYKKNIHTRAHVTHTAVCKIIALKSYQVSSVRSMKKGIL